MLTGSLRRRGAPAIAPVLVERLQGLATTAVNLQAVPAVQETKTSSPGLFSKIFGLSSQRVSVPLTDPLPNVGQPSPVAPPSSPPSTETTTLSNGVKVVSEATYGPTATVGIFIENGSVYETAETAGCSHLLEYMAWKATQNRTTFRLVREIEGLGAQVIGTASREQMVYGIDFVRSNAAEAIEILADSVLNPRFNPWEVKAAVTKLEADLKKYKSNHESELTEALHAVGFKGALSRPLVCPEEALRGLNADKLAQFVADNYTAPRMVVAASGISHRELVPLVDPLMSQLQATSPAPQPSSTYVGGDYRRNSVASLTHSALAFQTPGGWKDLKASVGITVLQFLLGGGGSFSTGGPGKGMHSRLYRNVLANYSWAENAAAFSNIHNDTGLFGITVSANSKNAAESMDVICKELLALTKDVESQDLQRAKNAALGQVLINLESRAIIAEDIGRQVLTYGHRKPVKEVVDAINAVTPSDISKLVSSLVKTPITHASIGDVANIPRLDEISSRFK